MTCSWLEALSVPWPLFANHPHPSQVPGLALSHEQVSARLVPTSVCVCLKGPMLLVPYQDWLAKSG